MDDQTPEEERRESMAAPTAQPVEDEELVQLTGRVPKSLRRRLKMAAVAQDASSQDLQQRAIEEYLDRHGF